MKRLFWSVLLAGFVVGCTTTPPVEQADDNLPQSSSEPDSSSEAAQVTAVEATSNSTGSYTFSVTISSPDTGCDNYANWWEVLSPDGTLIYRRILAHSHVDEQPFTRSGGPVAVEADQPIIVRVHTHPSGYSPYAMTGLIGKSLVPETLSPTFAAELANADPLPSGCAF